MPADVIGVAGTRVVRVEPVSLTSAEDYLVKSSVAPARWRSVLDAMRDGGSPVAQALSTPLMLYPARVVFEDSRRDPAELPAPGLNARESVETELLRSYVLAASAPSEQSPDLATESTVRFEAADAERWLRYLAGFLDTHHTTVFRWWELAGFGPAPRRPVDRWNWFPSTRHPRQHLSAAGRSFCEAVTSKTTRFISSTVGTTSYSTESHRFPCRRKSIRRDAGVMVTDRAPPAASRA